MSEPTLSAPALDDEAARAIIKAMAPLLGIQVDPAWQATVAANLRAVSAAAGLVLDFPLPDELEPAPVFRA